MSRIKIVEVHSEMGAGTRGASLGIDAIKFASLNVYSDYFRNYPSTCINSPENVLFHPIETPHAKRIRQINTLYQEIGDEVKKTLINGVFPIVLSGDHSCAGGTLAGIKGAFPEKRIGTIWIDAHADLHSPYTTPSGNMHGMSLAVSAGLDNLLLQSNNPSGLTKQLWEELKLQGGSRSKVQPEDIVFFALRDVEDQEVALIERYGMPNITPRRLRALGVQKVITEALHHLRDCDLIYISFDVDSMDPFKVSRGTGTPVNGGLTEGEATAILRGLIADERVVCFEFTEVNPVLDNKGNVMAETAFRILEHTTRALSQRFRQTLGVSENFH